MLYAVLYEVLFFSGVDSVGVGVTRRMMSLSSFLARREADIGVEDPAAFGRRGEGRAVNGMERSVVRTVNDGFGVW